jgi:hypothetical protein
MIKRVAKLTKPAVILAVALGTILSPTVSTANPPAKAGHHHTQVVHQSARQTVHFQSQQRLTTDPGNNADDFYNPPRSPNFDELLH